MSHAMEDIGGQLIAYEQGELDEEGAIALFSRLIITGLAWTLQGSYGRQAMRFIESGVLSRTGEILV